MAVKLVRSRKRILNSVITRLNKEAKKFKDFVKKKGKKVIIKTVTKELEKIPIIGTLISEYINERYKDDTEIDLDKILNYLEDMRDCDKTHFEYLVNRLNLMSKDTTKYHKQILKTFDITMNGIDKNFDKLYDYLSKRFDDLEDKIDTSTAAILDEIKKEREERKKLEKSIEKLSVKIDKIVPEIYDKETEHHFKSKEKAKIEKTKGKTEDYEHKYHKLLKDPVLYLNLGSFEYFDENYDQAIYNFEKAIKIDSQYESAWVYKGIVLTEMEYYYKAIKCYDKALKINPEFEKAWINKGIALAKLDKFKDAIKCYERSKQINPEFATIWYNEGISLAKLKRYDEAIEHFDKAIKIKPKFGKAWFGNACVYSLTNNIQETLKYLKQAIKLDNKFIIDAKKDDDFDNVRNSPEFKKLVGK